jgi:hypothetical protein
MKKMSWGSFFVVVLSASVLFAACSKAKDGAAGATGPAGTANVIYSGWLDVSYTFSTSDSAYHAIITAPKLVDSILQKGEIKVYINFGTAAAPDISPLPYFDGQYIINPEFVAQKINIVSNANASTTTNSTGKVLQHRYILIPGGTPSGRMATVDWNNYAAVKEYLHLKD